MTGPASGDARTSSGERLGHLTALRVVSRRCAPRAPKMDTRFDQAERLKPSRIAHDLEQGPGVLGGTSRMERVAGAWAGSSGAFVGEVSILVARRTFLV